ncbi:MAG: carboxypeptidase-like regulatory domain-containing protein, partial [Actinomycetia bacterium]|nr:carboxypeptidase-like regulatory domain-containing protein [Actinomycetes bacterium]
MRKLFYLVVSIVMFGLIISGCIFHVVPPLGQDGSIDIVKDGVSYKTNLIAGQHTVAGSITVSNDGENLFVTYETVDNWLINETHLYVGTTIPANSAPGKFPYKREELGGVTTDTYAIPLDDLRVGPCNTIYIAAHAELVNGETKETGWAKGVKIEPGKNWAMYFNYQIWPCGSEIPELTEAISQEIDLSIGGTVEVIDPESIINGVKLIIPPIPSEKKGGKLIANITISYIDDPYSLELPDNRGFLLPPVVINSDILFDAECILEIPYTEDDLSNMGLSSNEGIKVYYYNYYSSSWEEVSINKRNYKAEINFEYMLELTLIIEDTNMTYAISTPSFILPLPFDPGFPQPGDLLYRKSNVGGIDGWIPGHVGIYVGEKYGDHDNDPSTPDKAYNVIEALGKFTIIPFKIEGKVEANYYNPITEFADKFNTTYLGARQPDSGALDSEQRSDVLKFLDDKEVVGMPYAGDETKQFLWGLARGDYVKGMFGDYNCVGLAEAAYESVGVDLVSDEYEGNNASDISARAVLTPAEQYNKTEPAEGYTVSGQVTDSQGVKIPDVTLNFELVTFNNNHSDSFDVTTNSNGGWSSDKLGREWKVTPQKDGYTFEPST